MNRYQSHKIVEAGKVTEWNYVEDNNAFPFTVVFEDGSHLQLTRADGDRIREMAGNSEYSYVQGGWIVVSPDGDVSWSPPELFEAGYDLVQPSSGKSKIAGYRELNETEVANMNAIKEWGHQAGELVEGLRVMDSVDQRWVSIGATNIQQGLMALTRAITKPTFF